MALYSSFIGAALIVSSIRRRGLRLPTRLHSHFFASIDQHPANF
jgi:hypothetical protein